MEKATRTLAVVMQRRNARSRWASVIWEPVSVMEGDDPAAAARLLMSHDDYEQWLHPGFEVALRRDEAEGYYLNVSSAEPCVFVMWRMEEERAVPQFVTLSYDEASRWMDGGAQVDRVQIPPALYAWAGAWVEQNYRPEPRQRRKPRSFVSPKDRTA